MIKKIEKKIEIDIDLDALANDLDGYLFDYIKFNYNITDIPGVEYEEVLKQINYEDWCYILDEIKSGYPTIKN